MKQLAALALLLLVPAVAGHAEPLSSSPAGGARLDLAPEEAWVEFSEPIFEDGTWVRVLDQDGRRVDQDDLRISGTQLRPVLTVSLQDLPDGAYRISWQTYSKSDGHTINGAIGFAVGGFAPPATTTDVENDLDLLPAIARAILYAGFAAALGGLAYGAYVLRDPTPVMRQVRLGGVAAGLGTVLLAADTWQSTGLDLTTYLGGPGGQGYLVRILVAAALLVASRWPTLLPLLAGWGLFAWLTASNGHITREGTLGNVLEWAHLVAIGTWLGGLWAFVRHTRNTTQAARFTHLAQGAVAVLVATGTAITIWLLWSLDGIWSDSWTWFLAAKVTAVLLMLLLAGINRWVFLQPADRLAGLATRWQPAWRNPAGREDGLRKTVRLEAGISIVTLLAAGLLMSVSPPAEATIDVADGLERTAQGTDYVALMQVTPQPQVGQSHTARFFITLDGEPLLENTCGRDSCVRMRWTIDDDSEQEAVLAPQGDGWWQGDLLLVASGNTTVELDIQSAYVYRDVLRFAPFFV